MNQAGGASNEESKGDNQDSTQETNEETIDAESERVRKLKANWTKKFLEQEGWNYILNAFLSKEISFAETVTFSE